MTRFPSKEQVKHAMISKLDQNSLVNTRHSVVKIQDDLNTYYNSVNIITGAQGGGKTFAAMNEIITISYLPETHLIIVIKKKDFDPSVEHIKELAKCVLITINYDEAEEFVKNVLKYKRLYNEFMRNAREENVTLSEMDTHIENVEELYENLFIPEFRTDWLNTLVLFDDVGNSGLFKNKDSYFNNLMKTCRDINCIFYLTIHGITQLSPQIKENTAVVYIAKGLSVERLSIIHRQVSCPIDFEDFKNAYKYLANSDNRFMIIDNIKSTIGFE
jgi:nitrogen regulatory protein PII